MEVPGSVTYYTAHIYSIHAKCLVGEKKETSGMRRVVCAAAVAKYRLKFLYTLRAGGAEPGAAASSRGDALPVPGAIAPDNRQPLPLSAPAAGSWRGAAAGGHRPALWCCGSSHRASDRAAGRGWLASVVYHSSCSWRETPFRFEKSRA